MTSPTEQRQRLAVFLAPRYHDFVVRDPSESPFANDLRSVRRTNEAEMIRGVGDAYAELTRSELVQKYGWTRLDARFAVDHSRGTITVFGDVALRRIGIRFARGLREMVGRDWNIVLAMSAIGTGGGWRALTAPLTQLRESCGPSAPLATELLNDDGPVQVLASTPAGTLIRGHDGTVGWTTDALTRSVAPLRTRPASPRSAWRTLARSYLGVPYKSGGTTRDGLDCSGLTQRLYRERLGIVIPRHSGDQLALHRQQHRESLHEGQLVFLEPRGDTPLHVGVLIRRDRTGWGVVHASSSRRRVVEDPLEEYLAFQEPSRVCQ